MQNVGPSVHYRAIEELLERKSHGDSSSPGVTGSDDLELPCWVRGYGRHSAHFRVLINATGVSSVTKRFDCSGYRVAAKKRKMQPSQCPNGNGQS